MTEKNIELPSMHRAAEVGSFDAASNTVEMVWTTGAKVRRYDWWKGEYYDESLVVEDGAVRLDRLNGGAPFLNTHSSYDLADVIGSVVEGSVRIEGGKGYAKVKLSRRQEVQGIVQDIRDGVIRNISVGYRIHRVEKTEADDGSVAQWRVVDWEPLEISAVPIPADPGSQFRSEPPPEPRGARNPCVVVTRDETPAEPANPTEEDHMANQNSAAGTDERGVTTTTETPVVDTAAAARAAQEAADAAIRAERERMSAIVTLSSQHGLREFGDEHVRSGTAVEAFRAAILDKIAERDAARDQAGTGGRVPPIGGISVGVTDQEKRGAAIEAALLHRADPNSFELTDAGREFRGMSLLEIARDVLEARGIRTRGMSRLELAGLALEQRSGGGMMATGDFPSILANVLNKTLRQGYSYANQTFRPLVRVVTVADFKPVSRVLLGEAPSFEQVSEHGEFKRGGMTESKETYAITTFGKIVGITRQVIINDDLSAFTRVPRAFGVQAAQLESDLVWSQILSNPTLIQDNTALFHANHSNLVSSGTAISVASVGGMRAAMAKQTGLDGKTVLNLDPSYLIVPKALQTKAEQFVGQIFPTKTDDQVPESLRRLQVIAEPRLDNGIAARDGIAAATGSSTAWYLAADVSQIDVVELAYLEGAQGVYTETRMGFDTDGVEVKVRLDVGAKTIDFRGLSKNVGG